MTKSFGKYVAMLVIAASAFLGNASTAKADLIWGFDYTGYDVNLGITHTGSGTFTTGDSGSPYTVIGIDGTADGSAITGLSSYAGADNLLYFPPSGGYYADFSGISFSNADGVNFNITLYPTGNSNNILTSTNDPGGYGGYSVAIDMNVTATLAVTSLVAVVPEPSSFALLCLGGIGSAIGAYRRRRVVA